jgi:hypothetical protein
VRTRLDIYVFFIKGLMLRLAQSLVFCVLFLLAIVLSVLRFTDSDYPFDIFKLFLRMLEGGDPSCNNNYIA